MPVDNRILALFDFDGTITRRDSLFDFIRFYRGTARFYGGMLRLSPMLVRFKLGFLPNWRAKERVLTYFFAGEAERIFRQRGDAYAHQRLPGIIKEAARQRINQLREEGADIYVVSASAEVWLQAWCDTLGLRLIATRLEVQHGRLTGKIRGHNCYGPEKVRRIREVVNLDRYDQIYGYGDSAGDREMLQLATFPHYRFFR